MSYDVEAIYRKYDQSLHWNLTMTWLGQDEFGIWIGTPAPSLMRKGYGPVVRLEHASVMLFPHDGWWTAAFNGEPAETGIYCDVTTPARWLGSSRVTMVDLDLDVCRMRDGEVVLLDADEFAEHQIRYGYAADVVVAAERAADWLRAALTESREPFGTRYRDYLAMVER